MIKLVCNLFFRLHDICTFVIKHTGECTQTIVKKCFEAINDARIFLLIQRFFILANWAHNSGSILREKLQFNISGFLFQSFHVISSWHERLTPVATRPFGRQNKKFLHTLCWYRVWQQTKFLTCDVENSLSLCFSL